ncbi:hypothetical protein FVO59_12035 [Microbacterium esteraromaticum]|uniref:Uncharacterized protein n=1 Tax=Microbacterium esteraromaticum TaxID=57043 RepID=A0A7D7WC24_9MICO|nr:hypothetical protein [Microbacterium esteraromaticum]QMU97855.1 hypothetical protein FVO59_12035 [Microbacterium esteraromaticum]
MKDRFAPLKKLIHGLVSEVRRKSEIRLGTVTQASPLRIALDGDVDLDETSPTVGQPISTPAVSLMVHTVGQRVICAEQHRQILVIQAGA